MPIYEYICKSCGEKIEKLQKVNEPALLSCPACEGELYRPISRTSFRLKGGGWYADGYSSPKEKTTTKEEPGKSDKPEKTSSESRASTADKRTATGKDSGKSAD